MQKINETKKSIVKFIKDTFEKCGFEKAVVGISGGIDSAVVAALCVEALGKDNVYGILMPDGNIEGSKKDDVEDGLLVCQALGISNHITDINTTLTSLCLNNFDANGKTGDNKALAFRRGNAAARLRTSILFDYASVHSALVVGTTNYTELVTGYFTIGGDDTAIVEPIISLLKREVFQLAEHLGIPKEIITKKPTARLWPGQTDESEMGFTYEDLDKHLSKEVIRDDISKFIASRSFKLEIPYSYRFNFI